MKIKKILFLLSLVIPQFVFCQTKTAITDDFDFGAYQVRLKKDTPQNRIKKDKYIVMKANKVVLDNLSLKHYNETTLIAYDKDSLKFFNINLQIDSQFVYRDFAYWGNLSFLIGNKIMDVSTYGYYTQTFEDNIESRCGTGRSYYLELNKDSATLTSNQQYGDVVSSKKIPIISKFEKDSLIFINHKKQIELYDNYLLDSLIVLFKNGKQGLYNYKLKDSLVISAQILPKEFNHISLIDWKVIVGKNGQQEFLEYYIKNKKMRFKKIRYRNFVYTRYKKISNVEGWINHKGILFDDK